MRPLNHNPIAHFSDSYWSALRGSDTGWPFKRLYPIVGNVLDPQLQAKIAAARASFAQYDGTSERPLVLYDSSIFGGCGVGFLLTDKALYAGKGTFSTTSQKLAAEQFLKLQTIPDLCSGGEILCSLPSSAAFENDILTRVVLEDFFLRLKEMRYSINATDIRSFIESGVASPLVQQVAAAGANQIVRLGIQRTKLDDESPPERIDDLLVTNRRIIKLPDQHILRDEKFCSVYFRNQYSRPDQITGRLRSPGHPLETALGNVVKFAFNELNKRTHVPELLGFEADVQGQSPLNFRETSDFTTTVTIELKWSPSERQKALFVARRFKELGIEVHSGIKETD